MMFLGIAAGVGFLSWWLTRCLSHRDSLVVLLDHPNERSLHNVPTPRTGGLAILGSLFSGLIAVRVFGISAIGDSVPWREWNPLDLWILGMTMVLSMVSFWDDRGGISVWFRFGCQLAVSCLLGVGAGLILPTITIPGWGSVEFGWSGIPLTILFLMWFANLYNFMDGMDGFAGGMTVFGCGLLAYFAWKAGHDFILVLAVLLSVASAGFLWYNFPPAKIFMGDVGSVSSGFLCGALIVLGCRDRVFDVWVPLIVFSPFVLDATVTLLRRVRQRKKIWEAHRTHYYQRPVLSGWGHRKAVLAEYTVMALCGGLALLYHYAAGGWRLAVLGAWGLLFLFLALAVNGVEQRNRLAGR